MFSARLIHAERAGAAASEYRQSVHLFPSDEFDLCFSAEEQHFVHRFFPTISRLNAVGFKGGAEVSGHFDAAIVHVPRSKPLARHLVHWACQLAPDGMVYVDGAKNEGIASLLKAVKAITPLTGMISAAHGKLFWFRATNLFSSWDASSFFEIEGGFKTKAGVFSAARVDPGSALLSHALPPLCGHVADLGAGWGYLSRTALTSSALKSIDLIEADHAAAEAAVLNCDDPKARIHWEDVITWRAPHLYDHVIMNPPFHLGRKGEPDLGKSFIQKAAAILKKQGMLWMVANRHLPYEETLSQLFVDFREIAGNKRFKVFQAVGASVNAPRSQFGC